MIAEEDVERNVEEQEEHQARVANSERAKIKELASLKTRRGETVDAGSLLFNRHHGGVASNPWKGRISRLYPWRASSDISSAPLSE